MLVTNMALPYELERQRARPDPPEDWGPEHSSLQASAPQLHALTVQGRWPGLVWADAPAALPNSEVGSSELFATAQ